MDSYNDQELKLLYETYVLSKEIKKRRYNRDGTTANKDSSKTKVYNVEWKFERLLRDEGLWKRYNTLEECQSYIDRILKTKKWKKISKTMGPVQAEQMKNMSNGATAGRAWYGSVRLSPSTGFNQYVILHELAHCAGHMHHDISFRNCLVELVSCFIGRDYGQTLKKMFKESGLKMKLNTSIQPYEKWLQSYMKMAHIRAARKSL